MPPSSCREIIAISRGNLLFLHLRGGANESAGWSSRWLDENYQHGDGCHHVRILEWLPLHVHHEPESTCADEAERDRHHAAKIGTVAIELEAIPEDVADSMKRLHRDVRTIINAAVEALLADNREDVTQLANEARQSVSKIDEHTCVIGSLLRGLDPHHAQQLRLSVDSLSRCTDFGGNIAEAALQKASPRP